jgi:uroporphyrinogen decarboxylase
MDVKENVRRIIAFDHPEKVVRVPPIHMLRFHGAYIEDNDEGVDAYQFGAKWTDPWGVGWYNAHKGILGYPVQCPLAEPKNLKNYQWLNPNDERVVAKIYRTAETFSGEDQFLGGSHHHTVWERAYMLVGMENLLLYIKTEAEFVREVFHRIMDIHLGVAEHYVQLGIEFVRTSDDLGTQTGLLFSPSTIQEFLLPEYKRLFEFYKDKNVLFAHHCCGNLDGLLDLFIDLGIDVLDPVQVTANDLDVVREKTMGKIALRGAVQSSVMMDGPVEAIETEIQQRLGQLGRTGGYFCNPDQDLPYPQEHLDVFDESVEKFGTYPITEAY